MEHKSVMERSSEFLIISSEPHVVDNRLIRMPAIHDEVSMLYCDLLDREVDIRNSIEEEKSALDFRIAVLTDEYREKKEAGDKGLTIPVISAKIAADPEVVERKLKTRILSSKMDELKKEQQRVHYRMKSILLVESSLKMITRSMDIERTAL